MHGAASENVLLDLAVKDDAKPKRLAMVQEIQHHVLSDKVLHVDLHEVAENEKVTFMVPVEAIGEAGGVKNGGGTLEHVLFKLKVRALPKDLPEALVVDVSHLEIGQAIHIGDIKPPPGVEILGDKHISVLAVAAPVTEAQEAAALEAATTAAGEVEMIKEKKEEGEEGEAKPAKRARPSQARRPLPQPRRAKKRRPSRETRRPPARRPGRRRPRKNRRKRSSAGGGAPAQCGLENRAVAPLETGGTWKICASLSGWAIRDGITPERGTTSAFMLVEAIGAVVAGGLEGGEEVQGQRGPREG